jgi:hypothetical protein
MSTVSILYPRAYELFRDFLRGMLRPMLESIEKSDAPDVGNRILREKALNECLLN